jgi:hypothetical protein
MSEEPFLGSLHKERCIKELQNQVKTILSLLRNKTKMLSKIEIFFKKQAK